MPDWAQIISDALDILKFDGAVQDTLAELRGKWGAQVPALLDERFDAIGIQYMKLPHEKGAAALGQELSAFGWALYNLDDEDEYLFALIPEEERNEWERYCKKQGQYCHLMKQQGRKWGDHAKEQDPGKLMPCATPVSAVCVSTAAFTLWVCPAAATEIPITRASAIPDA